MATPLNVFSSLSLSKKITLILVTGATVAGLMFAVTLSQRPDYQTLFSNLSSEDGSSVISKLKEMRIPYQIEGGGSRILVPAEKVYETRLTLAGQGIPQGSGIGFEIFDKSSFGVTEFVQKVNYRRALQGELSRTITQLAEVESARVHIVIPEKSLFSENQERGKVSVVLKLRPGRALTKTQVNGIVHLASSSVEGIATSDVTVVDNYGQMLSGANDNPTAQLSSSNLEYQKTLEKDLEARVQSMLEKVVGSGKVTARVSAVVDFKQVEKTEEKYDPDGAVVRSEQRGTDSSTGAAVASAGVPGVASNLPGGQSAATTALSQPSSQRQNETINYEISKVISKVIEPVGTLQKLTVAVLVDGNYGPADKDGKKTYTPRSDEDMQKITAIVRNAIGFNEERGDKVEVVNIPFGSAEMATEEATAAAPSIIEKYPWLPLAVKYMVPLLIAIMTIIFVLRPLVKWATQGGGAAFSSEMARTPLSVTVGEFPESHVGELPENKYQDSIALRQKAVELAKGKPKESANVIKTWLKER